MTKVVYKDDISVVMVAAHAVVMVVADNMVNMAAVVIVVEEEEGGQAKNFLKDQEEGPLRQNGINWL